MDISLIHIAGCSGTCLSLLITSVGWAEGKKRLKFCGPVVELFDNIISKV